MKSESDIILDAIRSIDRSTKRIDREENWRAKLVRCYPEKDESRTMGTTSKRCHRQDFRYNLLIRETIRVPQVNGINYAWHAITTTYVITLQGSRAWLNYKIYPKCSNDARYVLFVLFLTLLACFRSTINVLTRDSFDRKERPPFERIK